MEEMIVEKDSAATTRENLEAYFATHDGKYLAEDAVFKDLGSGNEYKGRDEVTGMLHYIYRVAFDARAEVRNIVATKDKCVVEAEFKGKHTGEFAGMQPTGKEVNVPFTVSYELQDGLIKRARIYMLGDVLMRQLSS